VRRCQRLADRFYRLLLAPTLFGEWSLIREWGRIGQPGTVRTEPFATEEEAQEALARKASEKQRRGYHPRT
jgi:predicted DNA-binding WGR domain protein